MVPAWIVTVGVVCAVIAAALAVYLAFKIRQAPAGERGGWRSELLWTLVIVAMGLSLLAGRNWPEGVLVTIAVLAVLITVYRAVTVTRYLHGHRS